MDGFKVALNTPKIKNLEEYIGLKAQTEQNQRHKSADLDPNEDEEEEFQQLLLYFHFSEVSDKLTNLVDNQVLKFTGGLSFDELSDGEPLSFEDKWGRKITKAFSLRIQPKTPIEISNSIWKDEPLKYITFQFWFFNYSEEAATLLLSEKQSLIVGIKDHSLFLNSDKTNYYFDANNKIGYKSKTWQHLTLQIHNNSKVELFFNGNFITSLDVKITLARFKTEKIFMFPFFQGEITEVRIWKKAFEAKAIKDTYKLPITKIFEDTNKMKIKMKVRKREMNLKDTSQRSINLSLSINMQNASFDSSNNNQTLSRRRTLNQSGLSPKVHSNTPDSKIQSARKFNVSINSLEQNANKSLVMNQSSIKSNFFNIESETNSKTKRFFGSNYLKDVNSNVKSEVNTPRGSKEIPPLKTFQSSVTMQVKSANSPAETEKIERSNSDIGLKPQSNIFLGYFALNIEDLEFLESVNARELFSQEKVGEFLAAVFQTCRKFYFKDDFINAIGFLNKFAFQIVRQNKTKFIPILNGIMNYKAVFILFHRIGELKQQSSASNQNLVCFIWTLVLTLKLKSKDRSIFLARSILVNYEARNWSTLRFLFRAIEKVSSLGVGVQRVRF